MVVSVRGLLFYEAMQYGGRIPTFDEDGSSMVFWKVGTLLRQ